MNVTRKVAAGGLGGALSVVFIELLQQIFHVTIDAALSSSITTILTFTVSYFVPNADPATPIGIAEKD